METVNLIDSALIIGAIIGTIQIIKPFFDPTLSPSERRYAIAIPVIAALLGALAGYDHLLGLDVIGGIFYGLSAVAAHTLATNK